MPFNDVVPLGNCVMLFSFFKWIYCLCIWFKTFFFFDHTLACRMLALLLGIQPMPPAVEVQSLNHWTTSVCVNCSFVPDSLQPHGLKLVRFLCPWDSPGKNTGVGCHSLLQGIFLSQGSNTHPLVLRAV